MSWKTEYELNGWSPAPSASDPNRHARAGGVGAELCRSGAELAASDQGDAAVPPVAAALKRGDRSVEAGLSDSPRRWAMLCVVALAGFFSAVPSCPALEPGAAFPVLSAQQERQLEGGWPADTSGRVLVVDFWASWCAPCKASFPALSSLQTQYAEAGLLVVGVSVDQEKRAYEQFVRRAKPAFPTVRDPQHQLAGLVDVPTMPTSFVVDRRGVVRFVHRGYHSHTLEELRRQIVQLLEEKT